MDLFYSNKIQVIEILEIYIFHKVSLKDLYTLILVNMGIFGHNLSKS